MLVKVEAILLSFYTIEYYPAIFMEDNVILSKAYIYLPGPIFSLFNLLYTIGPALNSLKRF